MVMSVGFKVIERVRDAASKVGVAAKVTVTSQVVGRMPVPWNWRVADPGGEIAQPTRWVAY
jgi:hypothetical protein